FTTKAPALFSGQLLPGLETALEGKKMGSRVLAVIPPAQGYGKTGNSQAGAAPTITIPKSGKPPAGLVTKTLIKGSGPVVAKGQTVVTQYVGEIWRTSKVFDSSWSRGEPFGFTIGATPSQVITGWDKGLVGQTVGSRVMLVVPPADGYGKTGSTQAGIKGTDTLVVVVDILGAVTPG